MPEIKKRIVIASVLKPLNDTRMTEKIATSLADDPLHEVHVIGFPSAIPADARITFHTFPAFKRLSFARWLTPLRVLRSIVRIKPSVVIVTTHELLPAGIIAKIILRAKLIYDVQENYFLNIRHTIAFPALLRVPIATYVRSKEWIASAFIDRFFLAETIYARQLPFVRNKYVLLVNKAKRVDTSRAQRVPMQLVFTGTLARSTGVFRAIELAKKLHALDSATRLRIIGYAALDSEREQLKAIGNAFPFIELVGIEKLVNHKVIVQAISSAAAGIIAYEINPAIAGRIPTKLYEYLGYGLPVIFIDGDPTWLALTAHCQTDFNAVNLHDLDTSNLLQWLGKKTFRGTCADSLYWESEELALKTAISGL